MMQELFETSKYDNSVIIKYKNNNYTGKDIKELVAGKIDELNSLSNNIVLCFEDNFIFIINLFASIYSHKNIYIVTEEQKIKDLNIDYSIPKDSIMSKRSIDRFTSIDSKTVNIYFFTSGSSSNAKCIRKSLWNLTQEASDILKEFNIETNENYIVRTTTSIGHLFGFTFSFMVPLLAKITIDANRVLYPESINSENCILVTTPIFLSKIQKYEMQFAESPKYILAAGSKLNNDVFAYFEHSSTVIEIYGSTETGVIAYRQSSDEQYLTKFSKVTILNNEIVKSDYIFEKEVFLTDNIEIKNNKIVVKSRKDRMVKIYDKRISLEAIENEIQNNIYVEEAHCFSNNEKIACLCALSKEGKEYILKNDPLALEKLLKTYLKEHFEIVPQKWKFIDELPRIDNGKLDTLYIENLFNVKFSHPIILEREILDNDISLKIFFNKSCNFYKGHFPNFEITPGVAQLYLATEMVKYFYKKNYAVGQIKRIKFTNIIFPNSVVNLVIKNTDKSIEFAYVDEDKKYSSGAFPIHNVFEKE